MNSIALEPTQALYCSQVVAGEGVTVLTGHPIPTNLEPPHFEISQNA
jgi:hypothetical protein